MSQPLSFKNILLTGATGVMGGRLLLELLNSTDATIYCLVRARNEKDAMLRIADILKCYDPQGEAEAQIGRIIPVLGDVARPHLGLSNHLWNDLVAKIDMVMHCAASVNLVASYAKIATVNVKGTANIVSFCLSAGAPMIHTSSFSMLGDKLFDEFTLMEDMLDIEQRFPDMDYEKSKFEAEKIVHAAGRSGLNFVILRPGNIWGDSQTGCYPLTQTKVKGLYYEALRALVETGLAFKSDEDFDITPVDYVARASLHIASNWAENNRRTFHLLNPSPINWDMLVDQLRACGYAIREVSREDYFDALAEGRMLRNGVAYRSTFTDLLSLFGRDDYISDRAKYDTRNTKAALEGTGISCPVNDVDLMRTYITYAAQVGFMPGPDEKFSVAEISKSSVRGGFMERLYDADLADLLR